MVIGLLAGLFWAIDTVILSMGMVTNVFIVPILFAFVHDFFSSICLLIYKRKSSRNSFRALQTKNGKLLIISSILGGPIGMSAYVYSIQLIGPVYAAMISSTFPAFGCFFSYLFLHEKISKKQFFGLCLCVGAAILLGVSSNESTSFDILGFMLAFLCSICWALEGVLCQVAMQEGNIENDEALQIRQTISFLFYGIIVMNLLGIWKDISIVYPSIWFIVLAALFGTISYLFYYKAIKQIGSTKAMPLDITYGSWALLVNYVLLGQVCSVYQVICGILILAGAICVGD